MNRYSKNKLKVILTSIVTFVFGCKYQQHSEIKGVVDLSTPLPVSNSISICWKNLRKENIKCKEDLQKKLVQEFETKTELQLSFSDRCMGSENVEIVYQDSKHVNSLVSAGGRVYSQMQIICGNFSRAEAKEIRKQCQTPEQAKICNINIGLHEFGHAIGLSHEDLRPESSTGSTVYDDDKLVVLSKFDHKSIMHFGYYKDIVGSKILKLTSDDMLTINKLYRQDLMLKPKDCTARYRFDEQSKRCFIKPTNGG